MADPPRLRRTQRARRSGRALTASDPRLTFSVAFRALPIRDPSRSVATRDDRSHHELDPGARNASLPAWFRGGVARASERPTSYPSPSATSAPRRGPHDPVIVRVSRARSCSFASPLASTRRTTLRRTRSQSSSPFGEPFCDREPRSSRHLQPTRLVFKTSTRVSFGYRTLPGLRLRIR